MNGRCVAVVPRRARPVRTGLKTGLFSELYSLVMSSDAFPRAAAGTGCETLREGTGAADR